MSTKLQILYCHEIPYTQEKKASKFFLEVKKEQILANSLLFFTKSAWSYGQFDIRKNLFQAYNEKVKKSFRKSVTFEKSLVFCVNYHILGS